MPIVRWHDEGTMTAFSPDYFIHVANVLLLVAYSVRDILWLRCSPWERR